MRLCLVGRYALDHFESLVGFHFVSTMIYGRYECALEECFLNHDFICLSLVG
jgi:hypothetical protein